MADPWAGGSLLPVGCVKLPPPRDGARLRDAKGAPLSESLSYVIGWSFLAYGGDAESKKPGSESHDKVEPSSFREPIPLGIAGSNKQREKNTCTANPVLTRELVRARDGSRHPPNATHSKNDPRKHPNAKLDSNIQKGLEDGGCLRRRWEGVGRF